MVVAREHPLAPALAEHAAFFNGLVQLVPASHYGEREHLSLQYMKKREKAAAKASLKAVGKQNKRAKLDPGLTPAHPGVETGCQAEHGSVGTSGQAGKLTLKIDGGCGSRRSVLKLLDIAACITCFHATCCRHVLACGASIKAAGENHGA